MDIFIAHYRSHPCNPWRVIENICHTEYEAVCRVRHFSEWYIERVTDSCRVSESPKPEKWQRRILNIYSHGRDVGHSTRVNADKAAGRERIACQEYEVELNSGKIRLM